MLLDHRAHINERFQRQYIGDDKRLQRSTFRPGQLSVIVGRDICWDDTLVHGTVSLTFLHKN